MQSKNRYFLWVLVMVLLGGATLPLSGQQAKIPPVPVPNVSGPIPVTADSHPFNASASAQVVIDLPKAGYVEEEFIISGKANVYSWAADNTIKIKTPDAPYATRILVRRPKDNARFSGTVLVEWFFEERPYDVDSMWGFFQEGLLARGDAWVGVTLKPQVIATLKKFDPKRYGTLSMKNPLPLSQTCTDPKIYTEPGNLGDSPENEKGLSWDMLSQAGAAMKSGKLGFKAERLYLTGMAEGEAITYGAVISRIAFLENGKTVFDGSIPKDNAVSTRLNQCDPQIPRGDPRTVVGPRPIPMIRLITEPFALNGTARRPDSDDPNDRFRLYEIAGANHVALAPYVYLPPIADYQKAGVMPIQASWPFVSPCGVPLRPSNDFPHKYIFNAALVNLDLWVKKGIAPPKADRLEISNFGTPEAALVMDEYGNAKGGIRSPFVDAPTATLLNNMRTLGRGCNSGKIPFSFSRMVEIYGTPQNYISKVTASIDRMEKGRWITKEDAAKLREELIGKGPSY